MTPRALLDKVESYYTTRLRQHGATHRGVDWSSEASQELRFEQLCRLLPDEGRCEVLDFGCGYGALARYLWRRGAEVQYTGYDIAEAMLAEAHIHLADIPHCTLTHRLDEVAPLDYTVASGIFNVRLDVDPADWQQHVLRTLDTMARSCRKGFAFNMLTTHSDPERQRGDLHYADPLELFDLCVRRYSRHVALLHDYPLYEFTVLVRTQLEPS
jgi:SAM-dependent methyltransferase